MKEENVYFPGLNGIRAIAATIVVIFHTDQWATYFGLEPYGFWNTRMQTFAVVLFFVLSGYLITYLLLKEKGKYNAINYRKFYIRRILRIWPVYYSVLGVGALLVAFMPTMIEQGPVQNLSVTIFLYGLLIPNIGFFLGYCPDLIGILWSVGAEEQFYAFWPLLINKSRRILRTLLIFLGTYLIIKIAAGLKLFSFLPFDLNNLLFFLPFDCMAIGGITAYLYFTKSKLLQFFYYPIIQVAVWFFFLVSIFYSPVRIPFLPGLQREYHAFVYAILILNVSTNPNTLIKLESKIFSFLGKISYGIYAYHFIVLFLLSLMLKNVLPSLSSGLAHAVMFLSEIGVTVLVSHLSYKYFESWFLKKKNKYMLIQSGNGRKVGLYSIKKLKEVV